ncbi:MAG TPA: hypothetical protein PLO67_14795 [Saprospiraceae bacterium]|nr:hypothetical protein [Saprospiraceae bacterium]
MTAFDTFNYGKIWDLVKISIKQTLALKFWSWLIGSVGAILGLLQIGKNFFGLEIEDSVKSAVIALGVFFVFRFVLIFIRNGMKYYHEIYLNSNYGEAIILLTDSFAQTHLYRKTPGHQDEEFMKTMLSFCSTLKKIFDTTTNSNCCVSIKVPVADSKVHEKTVMFNLARNVEHKKRDTKEYERIKHTLIGNTAFIYAFNRVIEGSREKYYLNNFVKSTSNYESTSRPSYEGGILPYESELVHPIVPLLNIRQPNSDCRGFICVDSDKKNAFKSKYEIAILEGVADGIYDIISERNRFKNRTNARH